jgi:antitoxin VapB
MSHGAMQTRYAAPPMELTNYTSTSIIYTIGGEYSRRNPVALNIKNATVEQLATEVARIAGESKTEAIRKALLLRRSQLRREQRRGNDKARIVAFLEREAWPVTAGKPMPDAREQDEILGYGDLGV